VIEATRMLINFNSTEDIKTESDLLKFFTIYHCFLSCTKILKYISIDEVLITLLYPVTKLKK
jgi:hypothetical protein